MLLRKLYKVTNKLFLKSLKYFLSTDKVSTSRYNHSHQKGGNKLDI